MDKDAKRREARRLRAEGVPLQEIAQKLELSKSVACVLCQGVLQKCARAKYADRDRLMRPFAELYRKGIPIPVIARRQSIPASTLFDWRRRDGLAKNPRSKYVTENLREQISKKLTRDPDGSLRKKAVRLYVDEQLSTPEIGAKLGVTSVTVGAWLKAAGINKRKSPTVRTREKLRAANLGAKRYNWKGGISGERRRERLSFYMRQAREACFRRDDYTCKSCGQRGGKLNAHHIWPFQSYPRWMYETWNLVTLCKRCHNAFHKAAGGAVKPAIGPFFDPNDQLRIKEPHARYRVRRRRGVKGRDNAGNESFAGIEELNRPLYVKCAFGQERLT